MLLILVFGHQGMPFANTTGFGYAQTRLTQFNAWRWYHSFLQSVLSAPLPRYLARRIQNVMRFTLVARNYLTHTNMFRSIKYMYSGGISFRRICSILGSSEYDCLLWNLMYFPLGVELRVARRYQQRQQLRKFKILSMILEVQ